MADEGPVVNVEDDDPTQAPTGEPAVAEPAQEPAASVAAPDAAEIDLGDPDIARDEAKVRGLLAELGRKRDELKATRAEKQALEQYRQEAEPYIQFLRANPGVLQPQRQPDPVPQGPQADPEAEEAARLLDFYTAKGELDIAKGRKHLDLVAKQAQKIAETANQPLVQQNLHQRASQHYGQLLGLKHGDGQPVRRETVDAIWRRAAAEPRGLETLADPNSLSALALMVIGADGMTRQASVPRPGPALVSEPSGGGPRPPSPMTDLERRVAQRAGIDPKAWQDTTKNYKPGRTTILEDD